MTTSPDDLEAVRKVIEALTPFNKDDQERIVRWAREKLASHPHSKARQLMRNRVGHVKLVPLPRIVGVP